MSMPGMILSQPGMSTMASKWWACTTISMESAMRSRLAEGSAYAVALAQAVADGDGAGFAGDAAPLQDAVFHLLGQFPHVHVAGNHLAEGVDHRHKGLFMSSSSMPVA